MTKTGKQITGWDQCNIIEDEIKYRLEEDDNKMTEDEIRESVDSDSDLFSIYWDDMTSFLQEIINKKNPDGYWKATVKNFSWRNDNGHTYIYAKSGIEFLQKILPGTDCTFKIFNYGKGIALQNWHHDSPIGNEWYYLTPCAHSTYDKFFG
jgi:hypothetical protein